ncbi:DUF1638 domain-containing protein [Celeribacter indicus]|uniref:DUF1638 domain-containing protein n=1 Tax=Celeribacter indicus TaxID=1208324 RepID=A0A0B5DTP9_9RHOB|nr:DUF1638 domain-containing protein [Celeribacter indicus]AJE46444.1 hypothetical protein P73_1729 [Celeribacter indicus]SDW56863.1 Protein of unknown function [Celeribacter indicus]
MSRPARLTDTALRDRGLGTTGAGRTLVIACGALAREVLALIEANRLDHLSLTCLPAILHNTPAKIPEAVERAIREHRAEYDRILVAYGDCGTGGGLRALCDRLGVDMIEAPHCYAFFDGTAAFAARAEATSFYLTDFLARQFDAFVWTPLGLDRYPELREIYFGNYETLVYLAQTEDPALTETARACADRLGLAFERRFTGYGDLGGFLGA